MMGEEVKNWIIKGLNDYKTAQKLINLTEDEIVTDTLCFHCQQSAEKFLKAFLVNSGVDFERTHSLEYLIKLCSTIDKEFEALYDFAKNLTDYAVELDIPVNLTFLLFKKQERHLTQQLLFLLKNLFFKKLI